VGAAYNSACVQQRVHMLGVSWLRVEMTAGHCPCHVIGRDALGSPTRLSACENLTMRACDYHLIPVARLSTVLIVVCGQDIRLYHMHRAAIRA
jgi:hypothetical protein